MTDAWTDKRRRGVMNLVVHSAFGVCFLHSVDCSGARKEGKYIFDLVDQCIGDIGEHNVVQVVTNNARALVEQRRGQFMMHSLIKGGLLILEGLVRWRLWLSFASFGISCETSCSN